jgi:hypothetical protein
MRSTGPSGDPLRKLLNRAMVTSRSLLLIVSCPAMPCFPLKDLGLLALDRRRSVEEHNLKSIYGIGQIPCDTRIRTRLDRLNPTVCGHPSVGCCAEPSEASSLKRRSTWEAAFSSPTTGPPTLCPRSSPLLLVSKKIGPARTCGRVRAPHSSLTIDRQR